MRAKTISALLLTLMLGDCAELVETNDLPAFEGAGKYFSPPMTGYCGDCGYGRASAWRPERPSHVNSAEHVGHGQERHHKHGAHLDHDRSGKP